VNDFKAGEIYRLKEEPDTFFKVTHFRGVFAWGYRLGGDKKGGSGADFPVEKIVNFFLQKRFFRLDGG